MRNNFSYNHLVHLPLRGVVTDTPASCSGSQRFESQAKTVLTEVSRLPRYLPTNAAQYLKTRQNVFLLRSCTSMLFLELSINQLKQLKKRPG